MPKHIVFIHICVVSVFSLIFMGCSTRAKFPVEAAAEISTRISAETPTQASDVTSTPASDVTSTQTSAETKAGALKDIVTTAQAEQTVNYYMVTEKAEPYPVPCLTLSEDGQFVFTYDVLSSYYPSGTYLLKDKQLTAITSDKKYKYIFTQIGDDTFMFEQNGSSEIRLTDKNIGISITDGAEFMKKNAPGSEGTSSMTGLCLISSDGKYLIIDEGGIPIVMSNQSGNDDLFRGLQTGDKVEITYDGIEETYPARTGVYTCRQIEKSSADAISENTLSQLRQLGWSFPIECE